MNGRSVTVPLCAVGIAAMWMGALALMIWDSLGAPENVGRWGLMLAAGAASWTVVAGVARQHRHLQSAFDLGRESVTRMRR